MLVFLYLLLHNPISFVVAGKQSRFLYVAYDHICFHENWAEAWMVSSGLLFENESQPWKKRLDSPFLLMQMGLSLDGLIRAFLLDVRNESPK